MHLQWQERNPLRRHPFSLLINLERSKDVVQWHNWNGSLWEGQLHGSALFLTSAVTNLAGLTSLTRFCSLNQQKPNLPGHIMQLPSCGPTNWIIVTDGSEEAATPAQARRVKERSSFSEAVILSSTDHGEMNCPRNSLHGRPAAAEVACLGANTQAAARQVGWGSRVKWQLPSSWYFSSQPDQHHYGGNRKYKSKGMGHSISLRCYRTAPDFFWWLKAVTLCI